MEKGIPFHLFDLSFIGVLLLRASLIDLWSGYDIAIVLGHYQKVQGSPEKLFQGAPQVLHYRQLRESLDL
jgi:hypothetical protein